MPKMDLALQQMPRLDMRPRLMMSAHMQQAIKLLQIPVIELKDYLEEQITSNPLLDYEENSDDIISESEKENNLEEKEVVISDKDFSALNQIENDLDDRMEEKSVPNKMIGERMAYHYNSIAEDPPSLSEHLKQEARLALTLQEDITAAEILIGHLDEWGFLKTSIDEIAALHNVASEKLRWILAMIQTFEPYGVGAESLQESLLIQLRCLKKEKTLAYSIVQDYYDDLLHRRLTVLKKKLKCSINDIQDAIHNDISKLDLHPGTQFVPMKPDYIFPDASIEQISEELKIEVYREHLHNLRLNKRYLYMLSRDDIPLETKNFIKQHLISAKWLMRNLQQRYSTLERIIQVLITRQRLFFLEPKGQLTPLTMKTVAEELGVHESTVARTVAHKYISTPKGILPLRAFFTASYVTEGGESVSSSTVKEELSEMIRNEDKTRPLTDEQISGKLKEKGIPCARRTVASYRKQLKIGNANERKQL